ncbi:ribonuclease III [Candidatus Purcelliella pentastirinorum]|nr:ribonuclease III [Candidatus Purcelliella pentastirinorum]WDI78873.1 ribonuclease III [Candidatus Purcelliella pentastirinorum]WDR80006.1 ribonuclease III [Candidatus Purcelliella pentastirinorum]
MDNIILTSLQKKIGYTFSNQKILKQTLTHRSANKQHNERMEFLGDAILNYVISSTLYKNFPTIREGNMSRIRSNLVNGNTLTIIAKEFTLGQYLNLGPGEIKNKGFKKKSILANSIEALIGGIFLDSNIITIEKIILKWYKKKLQNIYPNKIFKDPKTRLQEYLQKMNLPLPSYSLIKMEGITHEQKFTIQCKINNKTDLILGIGLSKKKAEQEAAKQALIKLKIL